jgi:hypothetical protein
MGMYTKTPEIVLDAWYSKGARIDNKYGFQYDVPACVLTRLYVTFKRKYTLSEFETEISKFTRVKHPQIGDSVYCYSPSESVVYKTDVESDGAE